MPAAALQELNRDLAEAAELLGVDASRVKILLTERKRKLASSNIARNTIILNRLVVGMLRRLRVYLIAHELAHIACRSAAHGRCFWRLIGRPYGGREAVERLDNELAAWLLARGLL